MVLSEEVMRINPFTASYVMGFVAYTTSFCLYYRPVDWRVPLNTVNLVYIAFILNEYFIGIGMNGKEFFLYNPGCIASILLSLVLLIFKDWYGLIVGLVLPHLGCYFSPRIKPIYLEIVRGIKWNNLGIVDKNISERVYRRMKYNARQRIRVGSNNNIRGHYNWDE